MDVFQLILADGQEKYVSNPIRSLAQAYVYRKQCQPFGASNRVTLTCNKNNQVALKVYLKVYHKAGFVENGEEDDEEIELSQRLYQYITLREMPAVKEQAAEWFHSKWGVPKEAYLECMNAYLEKETEYGWYLCLDGEKKQDMPDTMTINDVEFRVIKLLGKEKGGYSYLVTDETTQYVLKQIHHEPCEYYTFGDKLNSELRDYETLHKLGIPMPRLLEVDTQQERILKEYIAGKTVAELLKTGQMESDWLVQVQEMCARLYPAGLNIDYYPTNFVPCDGTLYYIDYECNVYMEEWDFEHWGIQYWTMQASERTDKT